MKQTKIIATIGPSSDNRDKIMDLYHSGVNVLRLNFSHSHHEYFSDIVTTVKELNKK